MMTNTQFCHTCDKETKRSYVHDTGPYYETWKCDECNAHYHKMVGKPLYVYCPLCEELLDRDTPSPFQILFCESCGYKYQKQGSYASRVTIGERSFGLDDMFDDSETLDEHINEIRANKGMKPRK